MSFLIKDDELLEKFNEIWRKIKNSIKKKFDSEPLYNEKYLKAIIKSDNGTINIKFDNDKIPREGSQFICLSVILIFSVFKTGKNYYPSFVVKGKRCPIILLMIKKILVMILTGKFLMKKYFMKKIKYAM